MLDLIVHGCGGKMGKVLCRMIRENKGLSLVAGIDPSGGEYDFPVYKSLGEADIKSGVIIDFSTAGAVAELVDYAVERGLPVVICTTGLSDDTLDRIQKASANIAVFMSANMSIGISLIAEILKKYSGALNLLGFDVEIMERHHNQKIDAPSGTAYLLANAVKSGMDNETEFVFDRSETRKARSKNEIGISSVRGGSIVGWHNVLFAGADETIEIIHNAQSKQIFASGAIKAAEFISTKTSGIYDMSDLI